MADGEEVHGSGHGEHGLLLEASVQHFRRQPENHFGQPGTSEGASRQEDRSERQPVAGELAAAWLGARQLHSATRHS